MGFLPYMQLNDLLPKKSRKKAVSKIKKWKKENEKRMKERKKESKKKVPPGWTDISGPRLVSF